MQTLICTHPGQFEYSVTDKPFVTAGYSILKIRKIGICGTDIHAFDGTQPYFTYPRVLGHELGCEYAEGDAPGFSPGDAVSFIPYYHCGTCIACRNGKTNCCQQMQVAGVHVDGGMVEYLRVPSSSLLHGHGLSLDALALVEPLAVAAHGIRRADVQKGEFVLVVGAGPIGLGTMKIAKIYGGKVIALDVNERRLKFCKDALGIDHALNATNTTVLDQIRELTNGDMPTVVIDATGNQKAINNAFQYMAHTARYVLIGLQKNEVQFSHPEFHKREGTLMSSRNGTRQDFEFVIDSIKKKLIDPEVFITHRLPFGQVKDQFSTLFRSGDVIKAIVDLD